MKKRLKRFLGGLFGLLLCLGPISSPAMDVSWDWKVDGAYNLTLIDWYGVGDIPAGQSLIQLGRLRFSGEAWLGEDASLEGAYELNALAGSARDGVGLGLGETTKLRLVDFDRALITEDNFFVAHNLDRLNLFYTAGTWEAMAGRQAISHGAGRFFNPTDIFAPVSPQSTYSQYKQGLDALRFSMPYKEAGELEVWLVAHEDGWDEAYYLVRGRWMFPGAEVSAFGGYSLGEPSLGLSLTGDLAGATLYGEAFVRFDDQPLDRLRAMAGAHRRFDIGAGLNVFIEGHFNGPGRDDPTDYGHVLLTPEYDNGELFLTGRWFTVLSADYQPHPLVTCQFLWLQSLTDGSALLMPLVDYEATQYINLRLGASIGLGKRPEALTVPGIPNGRVTTPQSEFGSYPNQVYLEVRFTF